MTSPVRARPAIAVVDDADGRAAVLAGRLADHGLDATPFEDPRLALAEIRAGRIDLVVTDLRVAEIDDVSVLDSVRRLEVDVPVIVTTPYSTIDAALEALRRGAAHYLIQPVRIDELVLVARRALADRAVRREASALRGRLGEQFSLAGVVAESAAMQRVLDVVRRIAPSGVPVTIVGEAGAGKGVIARALHAESPRAAHPYLALHCASLPQALLEAELFGAVADGAIGARPGLFEAADRGTVLLDEIDELPLPTQDKLLRVLETGHVRPVGAHAERAVDVRVLAATHRDLRAAVAAGRFRADLLYRLDVLTIDVPPLRRRDGDIPPLVARFLAESLARHPGSGVVAVGRAAMLRLLDHPWPGNVRELAHVIERGVVLASGAEIAEADLGLDPPTGTANLRVGAVRRMIEIQRLYARWAFEQSGHHKARTAEHLDVDVKTLNRWLASDDQEP